MSLVTVACSRRSHKEGVGEDRNVANIELYACNRLYLQVWYFLTSKLEMEILKWLQFLFLVCLFVVVFIALRFFRIFFGYFGLFS